MDVRPIPDLAGTMHRGAAKPPPTLLPWWLAGLALGGILVVAMAVKGPLGASTSYVRAVGGLTCVVAPEAAQHNAYFQRTGLGLGFEEMFVLGTPLGALILALWRRKYRPQSRPDAAPYPTTLDARRGRRLLVAAIGGVFLLFGARLAGGCTSGHVLSGVSQLAISSFLFFLGAFGAAIVTARGWHRNLEA